MLKELTQKHFFTAERRKTGYTGFSLIELLLVLGLIGVFAFLGMPAFKPFLEYSAVKNDAWRIVSDLRAYRQMAIIEHKNYRFVFNTTTENYTIEQHDAGTDAYIKTVSNVSLGTDLVQATTTTFRPTGDATVSSTIIVKGKNSNDSITITIYQTTGLAKML